jgi:predicted N-formylglutamate amidohydrolase
LADPQLLLTCEHGGARIPRPYAFAFSGCARVLASHRGYDRGALVLARRLARVLDVPSIFADTTRLLVDLNRSLGHPGLFSEYTRRLPRAQREDIVRRYYLPHRTAVEATVWRLAARQRPLVHVAVHSFTPVLAGRRRGFDVGLLYDPARGAEARFARAWQEALRADAPALVVRRNQPYLGKADGLTTALRRQLAPRHYLGIELEVNQRLLVGDPARARRLAGIVGKALARSLAAVASVSSRRTA